MGVSRVIEGKAVAIGQVQVSLQTFAAGLLVSADVQKCQISQSGAAVLCIDAVPPNRDDQAVGNLQPPHIGTTAPASAT